MLYALADLKTDWYLVVNIAAAIYYLKKCLTYYKTGDYVIFAFWTALALMTKGMIAAVLLSLYFMMHIISLGKRIIHFKWFISLFFIMVFTAPMFYGLYQQFDLNDNFLPNEKQIKSGVWFFIWHQSFGRITGANYFSNNYSPFFYLPYLLIFTFPFTGIIARGIFHIKSIFKEDNREKLYIVTMLAAVFCIFSFSNYKLPHYLLLVLPFSTILISMAIAKAGYFKIGIWQVIIVLTTSIFMLLMYEINAALLCLLILVVWLIIYKILDTNYIVFVFHILFVMGFMNKAIGLQYGHQLFHKIGYKSNIRFYGDGYYDYELLVKRRIPSISLEDIEHQCDSIVLVVNEHQLNEVAVFFQCTEEFRGLDMNRIKPTFFTDTDNAQSKSYILYNEVE